MKLRTMEEKFAVDVGFVPRSGSERAWIGRRNRRVRDRPHAGLVVARAVSGDQLECSFTALAHRKKIAAVVKPFQADAAENLHVRAMQRLCDSAIDGCRA